MSNDTSTEAPADSKEPKSQSGGVLTRDSMMQTARALLKKCSTREELLKALFDLTFEQFKPISARIDFVSGTTWHGFVRNDVRLNEKLAERFNDDYLEPASFELRTAKAPRPFSRGYQNTDPRLALVAAPFLNLKDGQLEGTITLIVSDSQGQAGQILSRLDALVAIVSAVSETPAALARIDREVNAIHNASSSSSPKEFAYSLVNSLCNRTQCEQVSFGLVKSQRIEVLAVSGVQQFKKNSPGIALQRQAMEECLDAQKMVSSASELCDGIYPIHTEVSAEAKGASVVSVPLLAGEEVTGVVTLRRSVSQPFSAEEAESLTQLAQPYGSAIRLLQRANRSLSSQVVSAGASTVRKNTAPIRVLMWGGLAAFCYWFGFCTMMFQPVFNSRVTAAELRQMSAPFEGKLETVLVQPGEKVSAGTILAEFDTRELRLELASRTAERQQSDVNVREALQKGLASEAAMHKAHSAVLTAEIRSIQARINRASIVAPSDGVVVQSDLDRRLGQVLRHGEPVMQFAPEDGWLLEIRVPDHSASYILASQSGTFAASTRPNEKLEFSIDSVDGSAAVLDEENVFIARAPLEARPDWMRTGMEGFAQVQTERKPVWWVALHRVIDWTRLNFWL